MHVLIFGSLGSTLLVSSFGSALVQPVVRRGDVGGFGLGPDFTWGVTAGLGYEL